MFCFRFSLLETSCEQDDNFPSSICVKVSVYRYNKVKKVTKNRLYGMEILYAYLTLNNASLIPR